MSATNRNSKRASSDAYATPLETVQEFLKAFLNPDRILTTGLPEILDPCCGGSSTLRPPYPLAMELVRLQPQSLMPGYLLQTMDIRETCPADKTGDFLKEDFVDRKFDIVISNPPYSKAVQFVDKGLSLLKPNGYLIYLLRLNFLGSQVRQPWWQNKIPSEIYIHSHRPSFTCYGTDACEYAHFVWRPFNTDSTKIRVI